MQYLDSCMDCFAKGLGWGAGTTAGTRGANMCCDRIMETQEQKRKRELDERQQRLDNIEREKEITEKERKLGLGSGPK